MTNIARKSLSSLALASLVVAGLSTLTGCQTTTEIVEVRPLPTPRPVVKAKPKPVSAAQFEVVNQYD